MQDDRSAFDALYSSYASPIRGFVQARVTNQADAEDVQQELWKYVLQHFSEFDPERCPFGGYVHKHALFFVYRYWRRRRDRAKVELLLSDIRSQHPELLGQMGDSDLLDAIGASPPEPPANHVDLEVFDTCLSILFDGTTPPHQAIVFLLCKSLGEKPREVMERDLDVELSVLARQVRDRYLAKSCLPVEALAEHFDRLSVLLERTFEELVTDPRTLESCGHLRGRTFPATTLADYMRGQDGLPLSGKSAADYLPHLVLTVSRRLIARLAQHAARPVRPAGR